MDSDSTSVAGNLPVVARRIAAFTLNLIAAITGSAGLGGPVFRFLDTAFPSMSITQQEFFVFAFLTALVALAVTQFWSTTTAKWVWLVPVPVLFVRMAFFLASPAQGSIMEEHSHHLWRHFFSPDWSGGPRELLDFLLFTRPALNTVVYSCIAWASDRWAWHASDGPLPASASEKARPAVPEIWARPKHRWLTATNVLIGINLALLPAMVATGVSLGSIWLPQNDQVLVWGANAGGLTLHGQYWRLVTASFIHLDIFHLAGNMICLWWIGRLAEKILGGVVLTGVYLLTAIGGCLLSAGWGTHGGGAGASGAILGIAGTLIVVVAYGGVKLPRNRLFRRRIAVFIFFILLGGLSRRVDDMGHLGGLAAGFLLGFCIVWVLRRPSFPPVLANVRLFQGRTALEDQEYEAAIRLLQSYLAVRPNTRGVVSRYIGSGLHMRVSPGRIKKRGDADGHALLGYAFHALDRFDEAATEYQAAMALGCKDAVIEANLAEIHARQGNPDVGVSVVT